MKRKNNSYQAYPLENYEKIETHFNTVHRYGGPEKAGSHNLLLVCRLCLKGGDPSPNAKHMLVCCSTHFSDHNRLYEKDRDRDREKERQRQIKRQRQRQRKRDRDRDRDREREREREREIEILIGNRPIHILSRA